jgi:hypothetical protein
VSSQLPLSADRVKDIVAEGLLPHGLQHVNWMAEVHTKAMQEFMSMRVDLKALGARERCARLEDLVRKLLPDIKRATGITDQAFFQAVFRRELPARLSRLGPTGDPRSLEPAGTLIAQVTFAASHFVVREHPTAFAEDLPFIRLFASGTFLAVLFPALGLPAAVAVHLLLNELNRTGRFGSYAVPSSGTCSCAPALQYSR